MSEATATHDDHITITAEIVAAYVSHNSVPAAELVSLITSTYASLASLGKPAAEPEPVVGEPAVPIRKSITPDHIICLEDGKKFASLRRHLKSKFDLTPEQYRAKWGLPRDYPMVAPNYAAKRSELAKAIGLGQARKAADAPTAPRKRAPKKAAA